MRLPVINWNQSHIDEEKARKMLYYVIDNGVNYMDTAYPYHNGASEKFLGKSLTVKSREKVYVATKIPSWNIKSREDMDYYLDK